MKKDTLFVVSMISFLVLFTVYTVFFRSFHTAQVQALTLAEPVDIATPTGAALVEAEQIIRASNDVANPLFSSVSIEQFGADVYVVFVVPENRTGADMAAAGLPRLVRGALEGSGVAVEGITIEYRTAAGALVATWSSEAS